MKLSFQIRFVSGRIQAFGTLELILLFRADGNLYLLGNCLRNLILQHHHITDISLKRVRPDVFIQYRIHKLYGDPHAVIDPEDRSFNQLRHTKLCRDYWQGLGCTPEPQGGCL